jgi:iron-sulfur cluster repair protein YtfE (RIC family)
MPDAITLLTQDHRQVEHLFSLFEAGGGEQIAKQICQELEVHTTIEEEIVYPVLEREVDKKMAKEATQEHQEAEGIIKKIKSTLSGGNGRGNGKGRLADLVSQLKEAIEHHVEEEENEVFPKMKEQVGDKLAAMGQELARRKQELLQHAEAGEQDGEPAGDLLDLTKEELYEKAKEADIPGRSNMSKEELAQALQEAG